MIRIGVVNIDVSHPQAFCEYLLKSDRARYVAVFNDSFREDDEVDAFIHKAQLEKRCKSIEELADMVDVGFVQSANWDDHIAQAMPFIERNKPVFIDKPIVGNIRDCRRLEELAANGAVILGSSSVRYCNEILEFNARSEEDRGRIVSVFGTSGVDEFNYAIHMVEGIGGLVGTGAVSNRFAGRAEVDGKVCESYCAHYAGGVMAIYNTFIGLWQPSEVVIMTTKGTTQFRIDNWKLYAALLDRICDFLETGRNPLAPVTDITEAIKIMLAGRISRENGGRVVKLSDIPEDDPGFDGTEFARQYAAISPKIYLNWKP